MDNFYSGINKSA